MIDIEPGMYISNQRVTFMHGPIEYYELSRLEPSYFTCTHTSHKDFVTVGWGYLGPSEVCKW